MKKLTLPRRSGLSLILFGLTFMVSWAIGIDEVPNVHVADRTRYVSNPSGVLSDEAVSRLDSEIASLWDDTSVELVVVAVDRIDSSLTPEEFATKLFEKWGIGKQDKDNGVLVLLSRDDHAAIIRTGYGVEALWKEWKASPKCSAIRSLPRS